MLGGEGLLDLGVADDAAFAGVDQQHLAGPQAILDDDAIGGMSRTPTSDAMITRSSW
jgi:hypothetical protein